MKNIFPNLDPDFLSDEVNEERVYSNIVTYFGEAVKENLHYHQVRRGEVPEDVFEKYEAIYIRVLRTLAEKTPVFILNSDGEVQDRPNDYLKLCSEGIREQGEFTLLLPEIKAIIMSGFDLKLIVLWPKSERPPEMIVGLIKFNGVDYS